MDLLSNIDASKWKNEDPKKIQGRPDLYEYIRHKIFNLMYVSM